MLKLLFTTDYSLELENVKKEYIRKLENLIIKYNSCLLDGVTLVSDEVYTNCMELLNIVNPNSPILKNDKEVHFIKELNEETLEYLGNKFDKIIEEDGKKYLNFYINPVGFNVRLVYENGELISARTFGRAFKNQDITHIMLKVLDERNDCLDEFSHIEVDGTLVLPSYNIELTEKYCKVDNMYQGVFSLLHEDDKQNGMLGNLEDFIIFIATDLRLNDISIFDISARYDLLQDSGFVIPEIVKVELDEDDIYESIQNGLDIINERRNKNYYLSDGARLCLSEDTDIIIFKTNSWKIVSYEAIVKEIDWVDEHYKKYPLLKFEEPIVLEKDGVESIEISEFLLRNVNLLLILDVEVGFSIRFAYFGEFGVLPITENDEIIVT